MTQIKICGLYREEDISFVNEAMPDYAGFILNFPRSHRNLESSQAAHLVRGLRKEIRPVCVFVDQPLGEVVRAVREIGPAVIQLHGREDNEYIRRLKEETGLTLWKAFRVRGEEDLLSAAECRADGVLLDNGYGTGEAFDWKWARSFTRPFILAGGLKPENLAGAIRELCPMAVDLSSGVESARLKDREKILCAVRLAHGA